MTSVKTVRTGLVAGVSACVFAVIPALAAPPQTVPYVAPAAEAASADTVSIEEIVVTATKRETNLQKTPISISVVGAADIKNRHVQSLIDLADGAVPSLRVATFEARQSALTIGLRGIVPGDANQPAREQGVGVYLDGVYLGRQHGLNAGLFDIERIEVLKGPQGTLFGRNTEGGALSMVLKVPTGEFGGRAAAGFGNYGSYTGQLHLDLPAINTGLGSVAFKLDGVVMHQAATTKNRLADQAGWNQYQRYGGRVAARWKPVDELTVDIAFDKSRDENTPFYSQLLNYNPQGKPLGTVYDSASKAWYTSAALTTKGLAAGYTVNDPSQYALATVARASIAYAKSYAAYGQATWTPMSPLHLTLGGRYTADRKHGSLFTVNGKDTDFTFKQDNNRFDPLAVMAYDVAPGINAYAKYATGYRAGGASSRSLGYRAFGPEEVKSYEIGLKTELFDRKVRFNLAGYIMDRNNSQVDFNFFVPQPDGTVRNTLETVNALGTTKIRGVEADLNVRPVNGLVLGLAYVYTSTNVPPARNTVQEQLNQQIDPANTAPVFQNVYVVYTPENAVSGTIDYDYLVGSKGTTLKLHLDANYADAAYTFDNEDVKASKTFIMNGRIALADIPMGSSGQKLTVSAWARNLLNGSFVYRRSNANGAVLGDYGNLNAPRTYGVEAAINF